MKNFYNIFDRITNDYYKYFKWIPDSIYLKWKFRGRMDKKLDLNNPKTYSEKIQWLKLYDQNPNYIQLVDKIKVKDFIANEIGEQYLIPTIDIYENVNEIDFNTLPNQFVLKCNHDSGGVIICENKEDLDINLTLTRLSNFLKNNFYFYGREWVYKKIKPKIMVEKFMPLDTDNSAEYKLFCFNGKVEYILVRNIANHDYSQNYNDYFDRDFIRLPLRVTNDNSNHVIKKPKQLTEMINIAEKLSKNIPHVRVDLYVVNEKIYFGELTFYPNSGFQKFDPEEYDYLFGEKITVI